MTGNVKTLNKPSEPVGLVNMEEYAKTRNISAFKFCVLYVLMAITIIACFVLTVLSLRISYLANSSIRELRDEVTELKALLHKSWIIQMPEFEKSVYDDHVYASDPSVNDFSGEENSGEDMDSSDVAIGMLRYTEPDGSTTANPESLLAKILLSNDSKHRFVRDVDASIEIMQPFNATTEVKAEHAVLPLQISDLTITDIPNDKEEKNGRYFAKRSSVQKQLRVPFAAAKLTKASPELRDSVEEFSVEPEPMTPKMEIPSKRNKNRSRHNFEAGPAKKKVIPAVHYDGDSSGYVVGKHTNYNGNGHLSHPSQIYSDWVEAEWVKTMGMDEYFELEKGLVKVKDHGLYLIYVQIYYLDDHDTNGYRVFKNEEALLQCTTMTHSTERIYKGNTCYTSRVEYLKENDVISIRDLANSRYTIFETGKSFFGLMKFK